MTNSCVNLVYFLDIVKNAQRLASGHKKPLRVALDPGRLPAVDLLRLQPVPGVGVDFIKAMGAG